MSSRKKGVQLKSNPSHKVSKLPSSSHHRNKKLQSTSARINSPPPDQQLTSTNSVPSMNEESTATRTMGSVTTKKKGVQVKANPTHKVVKMLSSSCSKPPTETHSSSSSSLTTELEAQQYKPQKVQCNISGLEGITFKIIVHNNNCYIHNYYDYANVADTGWRIASEVSLRQKFAHVIKILYAAISQWICGCRL